jgi:hypothetical protein
MNKSEFGITQKTNAIERHCDLVMDPDLSAQNRPRELEALRILARDTRNTSLLSALARLNFPDQRKNKETQNPT